MTNETLKRTPLYNIHIENNAKMVEFAGYEMPMQYKSGIIKEHNWCRKSACLFDVSHMGQAKLIGKNIKEALEKITPSAFLGLGENRQKYTVLTNQEGGIIDDLMVANLGESFSIVVNASRKEQDFKHIKQNLDDNVELIELPDRALLALQGPKAKDVMSSLSKETSSMKFMDAKWISIERLPCLVTRSGYTGEDGFEISVASKEVSIIARKILEFEEVELAGLGARDTLRLEAGLCLYGNDINEKTTPIEANIGWVVGKRRIEEKTFLGAKKIINQIENQPKKKLVAIKPEGKTPVRNGCLILGENEQEIGKITSGSFSPTLEAPIALGYVKTKYSNENTELNLVVRNKIIKAKVTSLPFVPHKYLKS